MPYPLAAVRGSKPVPGGIAAIAFVSAVQNSDNTVSVTFSKNVSVASEDFPPVVVGKSGVGFLAPNPGGSGVGGPTINYVWSNGAAVAASDSITLTLPAGTVTASDATQNAAASGLAMTNNSALTKPVFVSATVTDNILDITFDKNVQDNFGSSGLKPILFNIDVTLTGTYDSGGGTTVLRYILDTPATEGQSLQINCAAGMVYDDQYSFPSFSSGDQPVTNLSVTRPVLLHHNFDVNRLYLEWDGPVYAGYGYFPPYPSIALTGTVALVVLDAYGYSRPDGVAILGYGTPPFAYDTATLDIGQDTYTIGDFTGVGNVPISIPALNSSTFTQSAMGHDVQVDPYFDGMFGPNGNIDWGDGNNEDFFSLGYVSHNYVSTGDFMIVMTRVDGLKIRSFFSSED